MLDSGFFQVPSAQWGFASSPVIHDGNVIVQVDVQKDGFIAALDAASGNEVWRVARADVPTWSTPNVWPVGGSGGESARTLVLANGWKHIGAYDFATGREVWKLVGGGDIPVPARRSTRRASATARAGSPARQWRPTARSTSPASRAT